MQSQSFVAADGRKRRKNHLKKLGKKAKARDCDTEDTCSARGRINGLS
jgi:hypothetical protein